MSKPLSVPHEPHICVAGAVNIDLIAKVRRLPVLGETVYADSFLLDCGGKGSNQAIMARKLGAHVAMVAKIGRDVFGERALKNFEQHGVETSCVFRDEDRPSGLASILVDEHGANAIVYVPGANFGVTPQDIRAAGRAIAKADVVVCQLEIPLDATFEVLRAAKSNGWARTIFNPAPAARVTSELMALCDVVVPNEVETEAMTGTRVRGMEDAGNAGRRLLDAGAAAAVITLGRRGALVVDLDGTEHIPGIPVETVDSTGAGDVFVATLAYFLGRRQTLRRAARIANAAAALSVTKPGTQSSFPSRPQVDEFAARSGAEL